MIMLAVEEPEIEPPDQEKAVPFVVLAVNSTVPPEEQIIPLDGFEEISERVVTATEVLTLPHEPFVSST